MADKFRWKEWLKLDSHGSVPDKPGAYVIATLKPIQRVVGRDDEGTLDIGESVDLRKRTDNFLKCATGRKKAGHSAGRRYYKLKYAREFELSSLYIKFYLAKTKDLAHKREGKLLNEYLCKHKELPPLNRKANRTGSTGL